MPTLYEELVALGVEMDTYAGDVYVPRTDATIKIAQRHGIRFRILRSDKDQKMWIELKFQNDPYYKKNPWEAKAWEPPLTKFRIPLLKDQPK